ncbi:MAG: bifunctional acetate--CoA ligase family protein/GNAT family N-acetyltransferase [Rhodobiaceae bacterium]|nr:bifunctional acetate--CoA ligase family protein/GNAT family N-acetyltransferase [Rhodobiaceae bacterium]MCC0054647.1 bifunctional acetate--CoA ligase family protein/GNAT family N-acetyltransferase [Rhodobiaceae bacterium]
MTIRNLEYAVEPRSLAIIGASPRPGSVGHVVMQNVLDAGFEGSVVAVNPKYDEVLGRPCYRDVSALPEPPDLAVIASPAETVPGLITALGQKGTRAAVIITAGLTRANGLRQAMLDACAPFTFRVIGPNTLGLIVPPARLNASFAHMNADPGQIALLSQSGAIAASVIDWAKGKGIGFSHIVSLGDMADVDVGDYLDMLAGDRHTKAILLYLETVTEPRKFMAAARAAGRTKPVVAIKSGRHEEAAKAAATHTGALSGGDAAMDAALQRAGILRVTRLDDLFDAIETLTRFPQLTRGRTAIVTNGGGAGVLAVDQLMDQNGELADLSPPTIEALNNVLPANWSHANPVDIIGDAPPDRYVASLKTVAADENVDTLIVMNCPTGLGSSQQAAEAVASIVSGGTIDGKPVLACWLGESTASQGRQILQSAGVASYETPAEAACSLGFLTDWSKAQRALSRVPGARPEEGAFDRDGAAEILAGAAADGRHILTEPESKALLAAYRIPVPRTLTATTAAEAAARAADLLRENEAVVVKLWSRTITHKSDIGGVVLDIRTPAKAQVAAETIVERVRAAGQEAALDGFTVQPMVRRRHAHEIIAGISRDAIFGPMILFGAGGTAVEVVRDSALALPPLDDVLASDLIARTRISRLLAGYRDEPPVDHVALTDILLALSQMIIDFPSLKGLDINPILAGPNGAIALDARVEFDPARIAEKGPNPDLAIRPFPTGWQSDEALDGQAYHFRPIEPADVSLYPDFIPKISEEDVRLRFMAPRRHFPDSMLLRLTQLDYDREMAFVALDGETGALAGIGRISATPDHEEAEFALLVRTDLQGHGIGAALLRRLVDYGRADGIGRIFGLVLDENQKMLSLCRQMGFSIAPAPGERGVSLVTISL